MGAGTTAPGSSEAGEGLLVISRLGLAARAVRSGAPGAWAGRGGAPGRGREARAVAVTGACAALTPDLAPGHLVVASEIRAPGRTIACPSAPLLAGVLRRRGFTVHCGPVVSTARSLRRAERARHRAAGAIAVDLGSPWLATASGDRPLAVVRAVVAAPASDSPLAVSAAVGAARACRLLARASGALAEWAGAVRPRRVLLAGPRASCAGVERAIDIVEIALERYGPPIYVRKQIVHNVHVVGELERRGAIFVDELDEVPDGARVVFSAHGVSPAVREQARDKGLDVVDATCPLVAKVHAEARRFAAGGHEVLLIGHPGHEEVEGTDRKSVV